ncbi:Gp37-like protein [Nocardioides alkalitolerans]|uniref:Gp37-like protein n=1 Tax=Nocardioides alkalitolerans TaxID=281714 RepID=UPI000694692C|nr:hypothetical protein [Nocardioides alkalitolerans]
MSFISYPRDTLSPAANYTVEVRNLSLGRVGVIEAQVMDFEVTLVRNGIGTWLVRLPRDHPMVPQLLNPGSGICITDRFGVVISGPTDKPTTSASTDSPSTVEFNGKSDEIHLFDRLAYPDPSTDDTEHQGSEYDSRTGPIEHVLHGFAMANCGPTAPLARRVNRLAQSTNRLRGPVVTKTARFDNLGDLLAEVAAGEFSFQLVQRGDHLSFEVEQVRDRTAEVRLTIGRGLDGYRVSVGAPTATHAIVGAKEESLDRLWTTVTTEDSVAASEAWGRRVERFVDQAYVLDEEEFTKSAIDLLASEGVAQVSAEITVNDDSAFLFGRDWGMGDKVTVVVDGQELVSIVSGRSLRVSSQGVRHGVVLGDPAGFNAMSAMRRRVKGLETRLSAIERHYAVKTRMTYADLNPLITYSNINPLITYSDLT